MEQNLRLDCEILFVVAVFFCASGFDRNFFGDLYLKVIWGTLDSFDIIFPEVVKKFKN